MEQKAMLFARIEGLKEKIKNAAPNHYLKKDLKAKIDELSKRLVELELSRVREQDKIGEYLSRCLVGFREIQTCP